MKNPSFFLVLLLTISTATGCQKKPPLTDAFPSPKGLLISGEFSKDDVDYSEPIEFMFYAHNQTKSTVKETITIQLSGLPLPNPLAATMALYQTIAEFKIPLNILPGETFSQLLRVEEESYRMIGTGNYAMYFVEGQRHFDHASLTGSLELEIKAPDVIQEGQPLHYDLLVHNPTNQMIPNIRVIELHQHFEENISSLGPGETIKFSQTLPADYYQNSRQTGATVLTETPHHGSDLVSKTIKIDDLPGK